MATGPEMEQDARVLTLSFSVAEQERARARLKGRSNYDQFIRRTSQFNPFLRLSEEETRALSTSIDRQPLDDLILARAYAANTPGRRPVVFCMPKSGSSYVQSALQHALGDPFVSLTGFGSNAIASHFGMNSREQEIDELALVKSILSHPAGFVAQHHTRFSIYLGLQIQMFDLKPIVTLRNIFDCIVSFDDMMMEWRKVERRVPWSADSQFSLPLGYSSLEPGRRYQLLAASLGVWLVNFFLSWKRGETENFAKPLVLQYERDVLNKDRFVEVLADAVAMTSEQKDRLIAYAAQPDRERARLNVGVAGRGRELIPTATKDFLRDYAGGFSDEITAEDMAYLF
jgi:hypothetical protein